MLHTSVYDTYKMTQCNRLNVKLSDSQLSKLKSSIKNETDVVLRISSNMVGNSHVHVHVYVYNLFTLNDKNNTRQKI